MANKGPLDNNDTLTKFLSCGKLLKAVDEVLSTKEEIIQYYLCNSSLSITENKNGVYSFTVTYFVQWTRFLFPCKY